MVKIKIYMFFVFLVFSSINIRCFSQTICNIQYDTINKKNENGKKQGYWVEYTDDKLFVLKKKKHAVFYRLVFYDNGAKIGETAYVIGSKKKIHLKIEGNQAESGNIILLNGTYKLISKNDSISSEEIYSEGKMLTGKTFFYNGHLDEYVDYTDKYQNQLASYKVTVYNINGTVEKSYYRGKINGKWKWIDAK